MSHPATDHPLPDDLLVRYLDDEVTDVERQRVEALPPSDPAVARLHALEAAGRLFSETVSGVEVPSLPSRRPTPRRPLARAAAVALLFTAGAAAAHPPTRNFVADGLGALLGAPLVTEPVRRPAGETRLSVPVPAGVLVVDVTVVPAAGGVLRLRTGRGPSVEAAVGSAEVLVLPDGLRITPRDDTPLSVALTLPASVERIRLLRAGGERFIEREADGWPPTVELGPNRP